MLRRCIRLLKVGRANSEFLLLTFDLENQRADRKVRGKVVILIENGDSDWLSPFRMASESSKFKSHLGSFLIKWIWRGILSLQRLRWHLYNCV